MGDLEGYQATELQFDQSLGSQESDAFFEAQLDTLWRHVENFVGRHFYLGGTVKDSPRVSPPEISDGLLKLVKVVAGEPGPDRDGWEGLLQTSYDRSWLVFAIISKILHDAVFSSLLFGCGERQGELLNVLDYETLSHEGMCFQLQSES